MKKVRVLGFFLVDSVFSGLYQLGKVQSFALFISFYCYFHVFLSSSLKMPNLSLFK